MTISLPTLIEFALLLGSACFLAGCYCEAYPPANRRSHHARIALAIALAVAVFSLGRLVGVIEVTTAVTERLAL